MRKAGWSLVVAAVLALTVVVAEAKTGIKVYYPVQVAGKITKTIEALVRDFEKAHPGIAVTPVYAGNYDHTMQKAMTALRGGDPPDVAILRTTSLLTLIDLGALQPLDEDLNRPEWREVLGDFLPAFLASARARGKTWGIPFQISTPLFYYNKDAFRAAGLDPEQPPQTWEELRAFARKLTRRDSAGNVTQWGLVFPTNQWILQAFALQSGQDLASEDGTRVFFDHPRTVEAVSFWAALANEDKVLLKHRNFGQAGTDFVARQAAMMYNSTGSLAFVRTSASFPFGVAALPKGNQEAVPLGGASMHLFKGSEGPRREAALAFMRWMASPAVTARWERETGYISVRRSAFELPAMQQYKHEFPQIAVVWDQLGNAHRWWTVHEWDRITKILDKHLQQVIDAKAAPREAMREAQKQADEVLAPHRK